MGLFLVSGTLYKTESRRRWLSLVGVCFCFVSFPQMPNLHAVLCPLKVAIGRAHSSGAVWPRRCLCCGAVRWCESRSVDPHSSSLMLTGFRWDVVVCVCDNPCSGSFCAARGFRANGVVMAEILPDEYSLGDPRPPRLASLGRGYGGGT